MSELFKTLPDNWEQIPLGEACKRGGGDIQTGPFGSQLHAADYVAAGIPSIMPQNIGDNRILENGIARISEEDAKRLTRYRVRTGDIVYSRRGDVERRALVRSREDGWLCGTGCLRVRFGEDINPSYAAHYLGHPYVRDWIVRHAHGATMPNLNTSILSALPFVIPPRHVQDEIAQALDALDDKVEINRQINETLEAIAQALFQSWFVDFDPVRAKASGEAPESICQRLGLTPELLGLFPDRLVDSALGEIPEGWKPKRIDEVLELAYGKALKASERHEGKVPVYGSGGITGRHSEHLVEGPGIIVGRKGTVGSLHWTDDSFFPIDTVFYVIPQVELTYCFCVLQHLGLERMNTDAAVPGLNRNNVYRLLVAVPPSEIRSEFDQRASAIRRHQHGRSLESLSLQEGREALLPKLITGEVRITGGDIA